MKELLLQLLLVFGTAKILAELFERIGQPGLVGEILAGVVLGPGLLQWIHPNSVLDALSQIGVVFLLFRVGLEVRASELFKVGRIALLVAFAGVALPLLAGVLLLPNFGVRSSEALFASAATVATSVGITAHVLGTRGLLNQRSSQVILAAAVIDDILGLLVLAAVSSFSNGKVDTLALSATAAMAVAFVVVVARFGSALIRKIEPHVQKKLSARESQFHFALIVVFSLAVLAEYIGTAAIIGSFLAGLALSEISDRRVRDLSHGVSELLIPFFLAGIGFHLEPSLFANKSTVVLALGLTAIAVLTKLLGCGLPALALGPREALRVGIGMTPRGEVGMVVAQLGLGLGVVGDRVYGALIFMAVATTMIAPPLLKMAYNGCERLAHEEEFSLT